MTLGRKQVQPELMDSATDKLHKWLAGKNSIEQCTNISFGTVNKDIPLTKCNECTVTIFITAKLNSMFYNFIALLYYFPVI